MSMNILIAAGAFLAGIVLAALILSLAVRASNARQRKHRGQRIKKRKVEFSKLVLTLVLITYFVGVAVGVKITLADFSQLGVVLAFIGTPTAATIGFYCWKAKAENIIKIKKDNPEETEGIPVDLNNINT